MKHATAPEPSENVIATIPTGTQDAEVALQVVLCTEPDGTEAVELREVRWSEGIGWYTLRRIAVDPQGAWTVRDALTLAAGRGLRRQSAGQTVVPFPARRAQG